MRLNDDGSWCGHGRSGVPGIGEIIGGSQREERLKILERRMDEQGLKKKITGGTWIPAASVPVEHSGFGLGFERLIMLITGISIFRM